MNKKIDIVFYIINDKFFYKSFLFDNQEPKQKNLKYNFRI